MPDIRPPCVPLHALSARQQQLVQRHIPLVHLTIQRMDLSRRGRRRCECFQEGCLALAHAVRNHDPARHGDFAAYAMARVHYAVSQYVHEYGSLVRVPFSTQRRRLRRCEDLDENRHRPDAPPRVIPLGDLSTRSRRATRGPEDPPAGSDSDVTLGDLMRDCYEQALDRVASRLKTDPRAGELDRNLVERCRAERWQIPAPEARTPIRQLARELNCSLGRVTRCDQRFREQLAAELNQDDVFRRLRESARRHPLRWDHRLGKDEVRELSWPVTREDCTE